MQLYNARLTPFHIFMRHYRLWIRFMQFRVTFEQEMGTMRAVWKSGEYWVLSRTRRAGGKYCIFFHIISWSGIPLWIFIIFSNALSSTLSPLIVYLMIYFPAESAGCRSSAAADSLNYREIDQKNVRKQNHIWNATAKLNKKSI